MIPPSQTQELEVELLLQTIFRCYGYDFQGYARTSLTRRLENIRQREGMTFLSDMIPRLIHDQSFFHLLLGELSVTVTEMFRDPDYFKILRDMVIPRLKTYPFVKIWIAGCATGEEAYSMAILLAEEDFLDKATIYATDINLKSLTIATKGIYSREKMETYAVNYQKAGGRACLADYYLARYDSVIMSAVLRKRISFSSHNLVQDGCFGIMNLILCRNVLIFFNRELQTQTIARFHASLGTLGYLCMGNRECLGFGEVPQLFTPILELVNIYRKSSP